MLTATLRIGTGHIWQLPIAVEPRTEATRLHVGADQVIDLSDANADELARLLVLYRTEQQDGAQ